MVDFRKPGHIYYIIFNPCSLTLKELCVPASGFDGQNRELYQILKWILLTAKHAMHSHLIQLKTITVLSSFCFKLDI